MNEKESWGSSIGFLLSSIGYAVGLGAIWRFPYMIGTSGGGIFLLLCAVLSIIIAVPLLLCELTLGRSTGSTAVVGMRQLAGRGSPWVMFGWLGVTAAFIMISYYVTIVGDVLFYVFKGLSTDITAYSMDELVGIYGQLQSSAATKLFWTALALTLSAAILWRGVQKGIEAASKVLLPMLFVFLFAMAVRGCSMPGAGAGIKWLFTADFSKLTAGTFMSALSQVFFLAGVALSTAFAFGSYLDRDKSDIPFSTVVIVLSNFVVAILAGLAIFPALFSYGMDPKAGAGLVFMTMPVVFSDMAGGRWWMSLFFFLVLIAGMTSILGLFEGVNSTLAEAMGVSKKKMLLILTPLLALCSLPAILAGTVLKDVTIFGMDCFTFMDFLAVGLLVPIGALVLDIYSAYKYPFSRLAAEGSQGAKHFRIPLWLSPWLKFGVPAVTIAVLIAGVMSYL